MQSRDLGDLEPLVCSLQSSQSLAHWWREASRSVTWQRKEGPARTPIPREAVSLEPPTLLSVSPYHSMKIATLGVQYHAVCVGRL